MEEILAERMGLPMVWLKMEQEMLPMVWLRLMVLPLGKIWKTSVLMETWRTRVMMIWKKLELMENCHHLNTQKRRLVQGEN